MAEREVKLTQDEIKTIEDILSDEKRVEIIPTSERPLISAIVRKPMKSFPARSAPC